MMLILGGMGTLVGAVVGTFSYVLLQEWFSTLTKHWPLLMGAFIIATVLLLPEELAGLPGDWRSGSRISEHSSPEASSRCWPSAPR
jgi:branched-chain amino acid transport system permease protein